MPKPTGIDTALTAALGVAILLWATVLRHEPPPPDDERPREIMLTVDTDGRVTLGINGRPLAKQPANREERRRRLERLYGQFPRRLTLRCPGAVTLELLEAPIADALAPFRFLESHPILALESTDPDNRLIDAAEMRTGALWPGAACAPVQLPDEITLTETDDARWLPDNSTTPIPATGIIDTLDARARKAPAGTAIEAHFTLRRETTFSSWVNLLPLVDHPRVTGYAWHIATAEAPTALTTRLRRFTTDGARCDTPRRPAVR